MSSPSGGIGIGSDGDGGGGGESSSSSKPKPTNINETTSSSSSPSLISTIPPIPVPTRSSSKLPPPQPTTTTQETQSPTTTTTITTSPTTGFIPIVPIVSVSSSSGLHPIQSRPTTNHHSRDVQMSSSEDKGELSGGGGGGGANLKSWWKGFREKDGKGKGKADSNTSQVFAVPLETSLSCASVQISTAGPDGSLYVWGYIPVVVAKCGLHLKETATEVRGAFRVSGSSKRMKELQTIFETPPKYGKNLDWKKVSHFTPHDVATILRRYLTSMPEPIIPLELYPEFRNALTKPNFDADETIATYKQLIAKMPKPNQYLLLYVLDLLSVFAKKSNKNLMTASNLAMIFQPGILAHPHHQLAPYEHALSQRVLEFLIEHQDHFLLEMQLQSPKPVDPHKPVEPSSVSQAAGSTSATFQPQGRTQSPAQAMLAPPGSSSGGTSSGRRPSVASSTGSTRPPAPVRADTDFMLPSDSDDDAPEGGYYVHQGDPAGVMRSKTVSAGKSSRRPSELPSTGLGIALASNPTYRTVSDQAPKLLVVDNPPLQPSGTKLGRRRTAPSRRSQQDEERFFGRRRTRKAAVVQEAP